MNTLTKTSSKGQGETLNFSKARSMLGSKSGN